TNLALLRRRSKDPDLRFKTFQVGSRSNTTIGIAYAEGIINPDLLEEAIRRINKIDIDDVPQSGDVEEWIADSPLSPFPQVLSTERPDKVVAALMQVKFSIVIDGSPFSLIAPVNFSNLLQSPEDYYERWTLGSLLRLLRYFGAFNSIFLPALYIALI